jgi:hypothetical protein
MAEPDNAATLTPEDRLAADAEASDVARRLLGKKRPYQDAVLARVRWLLFGPNGREEER